MKSTVSRVVLINLDVPSAGGSSCNIPVHHRGHSSEFHSIQAAVSSSGRRRHISKILMLTAVLQNEIVPPVHHGTNNHQAPVIHVTALRQPRRASSCHQISSTSVQMAAVAPDLLTPQR